MRNVRINYAMVGAFVVLMLATLMVVVATLTGRTGSTDTYYTHFPNVTGVKYGTKVTYEGFVLGQVEEIEPQRDADKTRFRLRLSVRQGWPLPADSIARITSSGLLSAVIVDIRGGAARDMLKPGADIAAGSSANLFAVMSDVAGQVTDLNQTALKPLLANLNNQMDKLGAVLEKNAPELLANLLAVSADLRDKTPRITSDVQHMTGTLSTQVITDANARRMSETIDNMAKLSRGLEESRHKMDGALAAIDKVVVGNRDTLDASLKDLRYTMQTVARSIDSVTYNLEGTTRNMNEFSRQLRDNPGVLLGGRRTEDGPKK
jgi:phospholipid/cholesterol/gamma-HCH transport system substrate-binding protein